MRRPEHTSPRSETDAYRAVVRRSIDRGALGSAPADLGPGDPDVRVRELGEGETDVLRHVFEGLSDDQRALRYGTGLPRLRPAHLDVLCAIDGVRHVALVAEIDGEPVAIARYIVVGPGTAEVAVEVVDRFGGRGIARRLLADLVEAARARGVSRFTMDIVGRNRRAVDLARRAGARLHLERGAYSGVVSLEGRVAARTLPDDARFRTCTS